jgi:hypothetical protein
MNYPFGIEADETVLVTVDSLVECEAQTGSLYAPFLGSTIYYHPTDALQELYYYGTNAISVESRSHVTLKGLSLNYGNQAVGVGLADEVGNLQTALGYASGEEILARRQDEMKIETYEQLKAAAPEILKAAEDTARADGAKSVDVDKAKKEAADGAGALIIGLAKIHLGEEIGAKFEALVASGVSVDQYKAMKSAIGDPPAAPAAATEEVARLAALEALKTSGAQNPGAGNPAEGGKGYMVLVDEYRAQHKCSKTDAMMAVNRLNPQARQDFINKNNPGLTVAK